MLGGTLQPSTRVALDRISPFLAKRIIGEFNLPIQVGIKKLFDPNLVLNSDGHVFHAKADSRKSLLQRAREKNKQVHFYLNKYFS